MAVKIALDAMGGDNAPFSPVKAARQSASLDISLLLVGDEPKITALLEGEVPSYVKIIHNEKHVAMDDKVSLRLLREKENTMRDVLSSVRKGESDCAVSAGNTAAFVSIAIAEMGLLKGVERPAIAVMIPTISGKFSIFLDVGANINSKPAHLLQYAVMGNLYAKRVFGMDEPRVAMLNIGEEETKGDDLRREALKLIKERHDLCCIGNIEGRDLFNDKADVIVTDGFTGNVVLKVTEGLVHSFKAMLKRELTSDLQGKIGSFLVRNHFRRFAKKADYSEYGGGILLGVNGAVIISHGRSSPKAIQSALRLGKNVVEQGFLTALRETMDRSS